MRIVELPHGALLEQVRRTQPIGLDQLEDPWGEVGSIAGGHRLAIAVDEREDDVGALRCLGIRLETTKHGPHEGCVQEGQVGRADESRLRVLCRGGQPDGESLHRPQALFPVVTHDDSGLELGQLLSGCPHHDDRSFDRAADDTGDVTQQRGAVPLQGSLRSPHPG